MRAAVYLLFHRGQQEPSFMPLYDSLPRFKPCVKMRKRRVGGSRLLVWLAMIGVWGIDRLVKVLVQTNFIPGETLIVIPKIFHLTYVLNPGAAFGLMAGQTWIFVVTAFLVVGGVIYGQFRISRDETITRLALGMIGGGALGNLYDRLVIGRVVDYLDFQIWPYVFNFADSMIVVGAGLLMLALYQEEKSKDQSKDESKGEFKDQPNGESITEK